MKREGFTLVELLVVLLIIGILAAVAAPLYLQNANRARASEAVATMSLIRQALRDWRINNNGYFDVNGAWGTATGTIQNPLPTSVAGVTPTPGTAGLNVDVGVSQYFSNGAFRVVTTVTDNADPQFTTPDPVDFIIWAEGGRSEQCSGAADDNCAIKENQVDDIDLKMDNSGRIVVSYDNGTTWEPY